eukprot:COSAG05_NODE_2447_length_3056_cov_1.630707_4_plen_172_part_00
MWLAVRQQCDLTCGICSQAVSTFHLSSVAVYRDADQWIGNFNGDERSKLNCTVGMEGDLCDQDIDECLVANGGCVHTCVNAFSSFSCECYAGYAASTVVEGRCDDVDECSVSNGGCDDVCYNSQGSFFCRCEGWSVLSDDGYSCNCQDFDELIRTRFVDGAGATVRHSFAP